MTHVRFYDSTDDFCLKFAIIYEETGAIEYDLDPVCVYSVQKDSGQETFGMLYYAEVTSFEEELHSEIEYIILTEDLVDHWTYPDIQPKLMEEAERLGFL